MSRKFFNKYENFWEYENPFGVDFLQNIFGEENYLRKYSLVGDGIFDLVFINKKIYYVKLTQGKEMVINDGKKAFRDADKDTIIEQITNKLQENNIDYTINSGKYITFKYNNIIFKIEVIKKTAMPQ